MARDRRNFETRELVTDSAKNFYRQEWTDPETGETTFRKVGLLSDPTMHGRASYKPTSPRGASGSPNDTVA